MPACACRFNTLIVITETRQAQAVSTIASMRVPATAFALGETFEAAPLSEFELLPVVAHGGDRAMPFLLVRGEDSETVAAALADDPSVATVESLSDLDSGALFRVEWSGPITLFFSGVVEEDATVLSALGKGGQWHLRVLFPERRALSATYQFCESNDIPVEVERINDLAESDSHRRFGLSEEQRTTLLTGFERGFYSIPREIDTSDLAAELGITHQALSERLRRAHRTLVEGALVAGRRGLE